MDRLRHGIETYCPKAGGNMSRLCIATALILTTMGPMSAYAQTKPALNIQIVDLDTDAQKCNISEQTLRASAALTLRNNRILDSKEMTFPFLFINPNLLFLPNGGGCVYNIQIEVRDIDTAQMRNGFKSTDGDRVVLCSGAMLGIVPPSNASKKLSDSLEQLLKACLYKLAY